MVDLPPLAKNVFDIYRAMILPAHCDHYGHMNVRFYAWHFDEAGFQLWTCADVRQAEMRERGFHVVVAKSTTQFRRELVVGTSILVRGGFTDVGDKSVGHTNKMYNTDTGALSAIHETVEVFFDPEARKPAPMPDDFRARLTALIIDPNTI